MIEFNNLNYCLKIRLIKSELKTMKLPFIFLRSAFAVAAISTGIFTIDAIVKSSENCSWGYDRECGLMLGYSAGSVEK